MLKNCIILTYAPVDIVTLDLFPCCGKKSQIVIKRFCLVKNRSQLFTIPSFIELSLILIALCFSIVSFLNKYNTMWKNKKFTRTEKYFVKSTVNLLYFQSKNVAFTNFLSKMSERKFLEFPHCVKGSTISKFHLSKMGIK